MKYLSAFLTHNLHLWDGGGGGGRVLLGMFGGGVQLSSPNPELISD